jgi:cytoskeletal protein RodZ
LNDHDFQRDVDQLIAALDKAQGLRKPVLKQNIDSRAELRRKLLRRLVWKVPLIVLLMSLAVWWQMRRENEAQLPTGKQTGASPAPAFTGSWKGDVTYPWQVSYTEQFLFQPEGDKLFGTASFLGVKRGKRTAK